MACPATTAFGTFPAVDGVNLQSAAFTFDEEAMETEKERLKARNHRTFFSRDGTQSPRYAWDADRWWREDAPPWATRPLVGKRRTPVVG